MFTSKQFPKYWKMTFTSTSLFRHKTEWHRHYNTNRARLQVINYSVTFLNSFYHRKQFSILLAVGVQLNTMGFPFDLLHQWTWKKGSCIPYTYIHIAGHLSAIRKWGGKTSDYAKSGGARTENSWQVQVILAKIQQKWGGSCPPCPTVDKCPGLMAFWHFLKTILTFPK